jgi:hypothetical protein
MIRPRSHDENSCNPWTSSLPNPVTTRTSALPKTGADLANSGQNLTRPTGRLPGQMGRTTAPPPAGLSNNRHEYKALTEFSSQSPALADRSVDPETEREFFVYVFSTVSGRKTRNLRSGTPGLGLGLGRYAEVSFSTAMASGPEPRLEGATPLPCPRTAQGPF